MNFIREVQSFILLSNNLLFSCSSCVFCLASLLLLCFLCFLCFLWFLCFLFFLFFLCVFLLFPSLLCGATPYEVSFARGSSAGEAALPSDKHRRAFPSEGAVRRNPLLRPFSCWFFEGEIRRTGRGKKHRRNSRRTHKKHRGRTAVRSKTESTASQQEGKYQQRLVCNSIKERKGKKSE